jgi:hypothetical protein
LLPVLEHFTTFWSLPDILPHGHTTASLQARENIIRTNANISTGRVTNKITVEIKVSGLALCLRVLFLTSCTFQVPCQ